MNDIRALLTIARRRLHATSLLASLNLVALIAAVAALLLAVADRLPGEPIIPWFWVAPVVLAVTLIVSLGLWSRHRRSPLQVALAVDDRLDLREKISTALHCQDREDPFARAAVADGVHAARDPRSREKVKRLFRIQAPQRWWVTAVALAFTFGVLALPQADLFAKENPADPAALAAAERQVDSTIEIVVRAIEDKPQLNEELASLVDDLNKSGARPDDLARPEALKRDALKKLTELNKRLDDIVNGEKGMTDKMLRDMMSKLETPADGPGKALAEAMAAGDFSKAKDALQEMMTALEEGGLDAAAQKQLGEQLEQLAKQLGQLAQQQEQLAEALKQAGLNPQLVNNPQAMQQAIDQAKNLNDQQKQQLKQMAQAQQAAQQMCQGLGGACQQMAQGMQNGQMGQGQMGQGGQKMAGQLNEMEQLQQLLQQAQAAAGQCQGQGQGLGQGMNMNQALQQWKQGGGMGQWGQGAGGKAPMQATPTGTRLTRADAPIVDGEIIASMLIDGTPIRGDSKAKLREVVSEAAEGFDETSADEQLPRRYHDAQKHYFGRLQRQVETVNQSADEPADTTTNEPASGEGAGER